MTDDPIPESILFVTPLLLFCFILPLSRSPVTATMGTVTRSGPKKKPEAINAFNGDHSIYSLEDNGSRGRHMDGR